MPGSEPKLVTIRIDNATGSQVCCRRRRRHVLVWSLRVALVPAGRILSWRQSLPASPNAALRPCCVNSPSWEECYLETVSGRRSFLSCTRQKRPDRQVHIELLDALRVWIDATSAAG